MIGVMRKKRIYFFYYFWFGKTKFFAYVSMMDQNLVVRGKKPNDLFDCF